MKARFNFLKLFALSHLTPVQKAHLSYAVRKDIEAREIQRLESKKRFRQWKLNRIQRAVSDLFYLFLKLRLKNESTNFHYLQCNNI